MIKYSAVALGTFDGLHIGHQKLINQLIKVAKKNGLISIILTLAAPVRNVPGILTTINEKIQLMQEFPIDKIIVLPNSSDIINQHAFRFFDNFLHKKLKTKCIIVGEDFAFGYKRKGDIEWLKKTALKKNVMVKVLKPIRFLNQIISSSKIRQLLLKNDIEKANQLLGRFYSIEGIPVKGRGLGTKLGFPTINLKTENDKIIPEGVFFAWIKQKDTMLPAAVNIGLRPTFFIKGKKSVEINIIDFKGRWNNKKTTVFLCKRLREEKKFKSINALKNQISKDVVNAKKLICKN